MQEGITGGARVPTPFGEKNTAEGRKAGRASDKKPGSPLAQGLDPPLHTLMRQSDRCEIHTQMRRSDWYEQHTTLHANIKLLKKKKEKKKRILTKNEMLMWLVFALFCCHKTKDRRH